MLWQAQTRPRPAAAARARVGQRARDRRRMVRGGASEPARLLLPVGLPLLRLLLRAPGPRSRRSLLVARRSTARCCSCARRRPARARGGSSAMATMAIAAIVIRVMRGPRGAADLPPVRRRPHRPADAAAEPPRLPRAAGPRAGARPPRRHADDRRSPATSTTSRTSTIAPGTTSATPSCSRSPRCCARACARSTRRRASAARSSR